VHGSSIVKVGRKGRREAKNARRKPLPRPGQIRDAVNRLRKKRYINYEKGAGVRGAYPVLIDKYEPRGGRLMRQRLNAWKNRELVEPHYEGGTGETPVGHR
jgi:hypothetical protein